MGSQSPGAIIVAPPAGSLVELAAALDAALGVRGAAQGLPSLEAAAGASPPHLWLIAAAELVRAPATIAAGLPGDAPVIGLLPEPDLGAAVALMLASPRIAGVVAARPLDSRGLTALAQRVLPARGGAAAGGVGQLMTPGTRLHASTVADHAQSRSLLAQLSAFAAECGAPAKLLAPIEQCADEMLANALYGAPVDARGRRLFAGLSTRARIAWRTDREVSVQLACDGARLAVGVRDTFGSLVRDTALAHLHRGARAAAPRASGARGRATGGAGLGLYLMATSASAVYISVWPGAATEVVCTFELQAPEPRLAVLGCVQHSEAQSPRAPARRARVGSRRRWAAAAGLLAAAAAGTAVIARHRADPSALEPLPTAGPASLEVTSVPPGATVTADGRAAGATPVTLTELSPGASVRLDFSEPGYRPATARVTVPARGAHARVTQALELADDHVRARLVSSPPGAEVRVTGASSSPDRTYTPAELIVPVGRELRFTLVMPRHVPLVIPPFTPRRGDGVITRGGSLIRGSVVRFEGAPGATATVAGAPHCAALALPMSCTLAPGRYVVELARGASRAHREIVVGHEALTTRLELER